MKAATAIAWVMGIVTLFSPFAARSGEQDPANDTAAAVRAHHSSPAEANKNLTNPVSEIWSLGFEQNNYRIDTGSSGDSGWSPDLNLLASAPVSVTGNWNLITRPVLPVFATQLYTGMQAGSGTGIHTSTGFGDITLTELLVPASKRAGNWLLGAGATFIFPTASTDLTGRGKWQIGPAAVVGYVSKNWLLGVFARNWTSFAGDTSRPGTNSMNLEPLATFFFPDGWSVGYSGNILADWKADSGSVWTVPLGVSVGKMVKTGVKVDLAVQWMPVHPDSFGRQWNFQLRITSVIPDLIHGPLL